MIFRDIRKSKNYTQKQLADFIGVKQSTVAMWETQKAIPSIKNVLALSQLFDVSIDTIYQSFKI